MGAFHILVELILAALALAGSTVLVIVAAITAGLLGAAAGGVALVLMDRALGAAGRPLRTDRRVSVHTRGRRGPAGYRSPWSLPVAFLVTVGVAIAWFLCLVYVVFGALGVPAGP